LLSVSSFCQHLKKEVQQDKLGYWFPSETRWQQIWRFLKLSDPHTDKDFTFDRMHSARELFDFFCSASRAHIFQGKISFWMKQSKSLKEDVFSNNTLRKNQADGE
jgi:hypothetical protein